MAQDKAVLIYVGDPLCSWCYGFSPEISKAMEEVKDEFDFKLIMGGLRPYNTETMADLGDFLKEHWEHVSERSGVEFSYEILKDDSFVYDTEPPARAVVVVRKLSPKHEFEFFQAVQKAFYAGNKNTNDINTYLELLAQFDIDKEAFAKLYVSDEMKEAVKEDFQMAAHLGVRAFPETILEINDKYYRTSKGYLGRENLINNIRSVFEEVK